MCGRSTAELGTELLALSVAPSFCHGFWSETCLRHAGRDGSHFARWMCLCFTAFFIDPAVLLIVPIVHQDSEGGSKSEISLGKIFKCAFHPASFCVFPETQRETDRSHQHFPNAGSREGLHDGSALGPSPRSILTPWKSAVAVHRRQLYKAVLFFSLAFLLVATTFIVQHAFWRVTLALLESNN